MFVYQDNKLYAEAVDKLIGVEIHPDGLYKTSETAVYTGGLILTNFEVKAMFGLDEIIIRGTVQPKPEQTDKPIEEPKAETPIKEEKAKNDTTRKTKATRGAKK